MVTELEILSVIEAHKKYRHSLFGRHFIIKSDNFSLRFINSLKDSSVGCVFWWSLQIQSFDFQFVYLKDCQNHVADSLSRRDYPECTDNTMDEFTDNTMEQTRQFCDVSGTFREKTGAEMWMFGRSLVSLMTW